jgi:hypothetical protein
MKFYKTFLMSFLVSTIAFASVFNPGVNPSAGTVTSVSVTSANGFAGTVGNPTADAALTITTTINSPALAGNGTAITAATTTGSGTTLVLSNGPTMVAPKLGTPASGTLTNCTGYTDNNLAMTAGSSSNDMATTVHGFVPQGLNLAMPSCYLVGKSFGAGTAVAITITSGALTVTHSGHGYSVGDIVIVAGATAATIGNLNQLHTILAVPSANTYTFNTTASGAVTAPKELFWFPVSRCYQPTLITNITRASAGSYSVSFLSGQADTNYSYFGNGTDGTLAMSLANGNAAPTTTGFSFKYGNFSGTAGDPVSQMFLEIIGAQ